MKDFLLATAITLFYVGIAAFTTYEVAILCAVSTLVIFETRRLLWE